MKKDTRIILMGATIVLVVGLLIWLIKPAFDQNQVSPNATTTAVSSEATSLKSTTTPKTTASKTTDQTKTMNYADLIKAYKGYSFQFSNNCTQVAPNSLVMKTGSKFLIDNRENKAHTFTFTKQKYFVKAYSYTIVTALTVGNQSLLCDGIQRATVNVQR